MLYNLKKRSNVHFRKTMCCWWRLLCLGRGIACGDTLEGTADKVRLERLELLHPHRLHVERPGQPGGGFQLVWGEKVWLPQLGGGLGPCEARASTTHPRPLPSETCIIFNVANTGVR